MALQTVPYSPHSLPPARLPVVLQVEAEAEAGAVGDGGSQSAVARLLKLPNAMGGNCLTAAAADALREAGQGVAEEAAKPAPQVVVRAKRLHLHALSPLRCDRALSHVIDLT